MRSHRAVAMLAAVTGILLAGLLGGPPGAAEAGKVLPTVQRIAGGNRFETAIAVSQDTFPASDHIVLAPGGDVALMVVASIMAAHLQAPLLLTGTPDIPEGLSEEIQRLGARTAFLVGPRQNLGVGIADMLQDLGVNAETISGQDTVATAMLASEAVGLSNSASVYLVPVAPDGAEPIWQPGMIGALLAAADGAPVMLTGPSALPEATARLLADNPPQEVIAIGSVDDLSGEVTRQVQQMGIPVRRITEPSAVALAVAAVDAYGPPAPTRIYVAGQTSFVEGLVGAPAVATMGAVMLLADPNDSAASAPTLDLIREVMPERLIILGGRSAISLRIRGQLTGAAGGVMRPTRGLPPQTRSSGGDVLLLTAGVVLGLGGLLRRRVIGQRANDQSSEGVDRNHDKGQR